MTPHIERAKKIPKQVKLGSEHFTKENKNQEMWSLITSGNFDTVTMPIEEGRKLWRMVNEGGVAKGAPQLSHSCYALSFSKLVQYWLQSG